MSKKKPKAPSPAETAAAQSGMNRDAAISQQMVNMVGQNNPWGSTSYDQTGMTSYIDSTGKRVAIPSFTQTTTFSPEQQAIFDQSQAAQTNLATIANEQSQRVSDTLSDPFQFTNQDAADWAYDLASTRILPQQQQQQQALEAQLINRGIRPGTQAYNSEMGRMSQANNDQMNQLMLQGRGQAFAEDMATRNAPLNELSALLSGSQVSNPAQMSGPTPQAQVGGVDYAGMVQNKYNADMANYQAGLGGLFGLAGSLGSAAIMASDIRVKENIERVGTLDNGLSVYAYNYKSGGPRQIGVMAQDVEKVNPGSVVEIGGVKHVDYSKVVQ